MLTHRSWTSSAKRTVGARQEWTCKQCKFLLPATFEVDHVIPLHSGGLDCIDTNAEALCNACHASKTLRDRIVMESLRTAAITKAKADAKSSLSTNPLCGKESLLDATSGAEFLTNKFLRFAYLPPSEEDRI